MKKILAVDDEKDILYTLEEISDVADFNIKTALSGEKALKILKKEKFSLIIVDYHMPDMSGLKLVKEIRKLDLEIPILVLTVDESIELANNSLELGATDFANKPIKTADLISRIKIHLETTNEKNIDKYKDIKVPKGMSQSTLIIVLNYLESRDDYETIDEIAGGTGLAYQTVHRYLKFLSNNNYLKKELNYGTIGRPIHKYKLN